MNGVSEFPRLVGPAPCDGCRFAPRCRAERLACEAFAMYAACESQKRWSVAPRAPKASRYEAVFRQAVR